MEISFFYVKKNTQTLPRYVVNVDFMHGDADFYSNNLFEFKSEDETKHFISFLNAVPRRIVGAEDITAELIEEIAATGFIPSDGYDYYDYVYDVIPQDVTCDFRRAKISNFSITYTDENGDEYDVVLKQ